ncbi:hypothetical protein LSTR_LSTR001984 [Laodelphax striatellus]|uniref:Gem-associated protein 8 n=1 Tax=Laodelphax striatellus TaxID=195883 RepID=A0A482XGT6_LAOST|nr:hypothetical protein LSTR_LSTR001984 [Laodelphax striatellus]
MSWWYWQNYEICRKWREAHEDILSKIAYANSRLDSSSYYKNTNPTTEVEYSDSRYDEVPSEIHHNRCHEEESFMVCDGDEDGDDENGNECDSSQINFEVDENFLEFLKISMKHKQDLKKERMQGEKKSRQRQPPNKNEKNEKSSRSVKSSFRDDRKYTPAPDCFLGKKRLEEMGLLYGSAAQKIIGMETALQLSFNKKCDTSHPVYWPAVPINLNMY